MFNKIIKKNNAEKNINSNEAELKSEKLDTTIEDTKSNSENKENIKSQKPKKQKDITLDEGYAFKAERFFAKNWIFIFTITLVTIFYSLYTQKSVTDKVNRMQEMMEKANLYVVLTTVDGRSVKVQKTELSSDYIERWLARTLIDGLIVTRAELTDNFKTTDFSDVAVIMKNSYKLSSLLQYVLDENPKESKAVDNLRTYLFALQQALAADTLPEFMNIVKYRTSSFSFKNNHFSIEVEVELSTYNRLSAQNKNVFGKSKIKIQAEGILSLEDSSENNPYGLLIRRFAVEIPKKPTT
ncbi:hypothetical protein [Campylobacter sp. RM12651]|uniref:hypothetical protein n=1 Tax=Campylobacter sp. RM12651 TaxID=1660079 RepID=UPI001EFA3CD4|nr:hypothetical protein [Campylobacter sp. RM12651]ULO04497.1 hypothetical protein AVBRAN_a0015 [Campylobacter sp. RM12651]